MANHDTDLPGDDAAGPQDDHGGVEAIGARVRAARLKAGLSQTALAERVGVSQPAVAAWETGAYDPRRVVIARLADSLSVSPDWLARGRRSPMERDKHAAAVYLRRPLVHTPVISMADAVRLAGDEDIGPHRFAEDYIPVTSASDQVFAVFTDEPCMGGAFLPNMLVVVDYGDRHPADGRYCLALIDDQARIRRWRADGPDGGPVLQTVPPGGHTPEAIPAAGITIIGCVRLAVHFL